MFSGLSSLRKAEKKQPTVQDKALQDYLAKQYGAGDSQQEKPKKRKKKVKHTGSAVAILDHDISGLETMSEAAAQPLKRGPAPTAAAAESGEHCEARLINQK